MRVLAVVVVASALLVLPSTPVAANTTVKVDGNDVVITVAVDCVGCKGKKTPDGTDLAKYWEKTVEDAWNAAFDKYPYCSKYKFKLKVDIKARRDNFTATKGRHRILVGEPGSGLAQTGWDGVYEPTPGGDPGQRSPDGTRYYQNDGDGAMGADATPTVIIHEFGHVIGLGDDRDSQGNALPNRGPTIMIGGARLPDGTVVTPDTKLKIDKNLIDRIGDQLVNLGKVTCGQVWKGTIHHTVTSSTSSGGPCPNPVIVDGKVQLIVKPNGRGGRNVRPDRVWRERAPRGVPGSSDGTAVPVPRAHRSDERRADPEDPRWPRPGPPHQSARHDDVGDRLGPQVRRALRRARRLTHWSEPEVGL